MDAVILLFPDFEEVPCPECSNEGHISIPCPTCEEE